MNKYWIVFKISWQDAIVYRGEFFISMFGWIIRLLIAIFIFSAVFEGKEMIGNYDFNNIVSYFLVMNITASLIFSRIGFWIGDDIHTGDFVNYIIKPISYIAHHMTSEFAENIMRMIISLLTILLPVVIFFPQYIPQIELINLGLALITVIFAYLINAFILTTIGLSGFWVTNSNRLVYIYFAIITIISGMNIPLDLFPESVLNVLYYLPFSYIFYFPVKLLVSDFSLELFMQVIIGQTIFLILFFLIYKLTYFFGVKKFEAVGR